MNSNFPLVTIVSPCYNHSHFVIESLESVRNQTYPNIEHIIIDDCSNDGSGEVIEDWIKEKQYHCIYIKHKSNHGLSETLNEAIKLSNGEFWSTLSTDDIAHPERTMKFYQTFISLPKTYMVTSDCVFCNEKSQILLKGNTTSFIQYYWRDNSKKEKYGTYCSLIKGNYIPSSFMVKRKVFEKVGVFNTNLIIEDWDMWLRISKIESIKLINEPLTKYRWHQSNTISTYNNAEKENLEVLCSQGFTPLFLGCAKYYIGKLRKEFKIAVSDIWDYEIKVFMKSVSLVFVVDLIIFFFIRLCIKKVELLLKYKL